MLRAIVRLLLAVGGAAAASLVVALLEIRAIWQAAEDGARAELGRSALALAELGVLLPVVLGVGGAVGTVALVLDPGEPTGPSEIGARLRGGSVLDRLRAASIVPVVIAVWFSWCFVSAHAARATLSRGAPSEAGMATAVASVGAFAALAVVGLAVAPLLRRVLASVGGPLPWLLDPVVTGAAMLAGVLGLLALGVATGDTGGEGGVLGVGVFGVLKRPELDLRPVSGALILAAGAWLAPVIASRRKIVSPDGRVRPEALLGAAAALGMAVALLVLCVIAARSLDQSAAVVRALETDAPLGKISLALLRRATDRDHDGYSAYFGGGDCDDHDRGVNPGALDEPGNGIDEDCSGADTPAPSPDEDAMGQAPSDGGADRPTRSFNVVLLTVDTLRADNLGFAGYEKPVSPNLDVLAAKSTVYERAYAMASYTGKSVGPMLIGKYPSENHRSFSHFDSYASSNVFVTERLHDAGLRTFAGMCHWYFRPSSGMNQGFDVWDTSALPPGMSDNDTSVSSDRLSDLALAMLAKPENTSPGEGRRFFAWFHYFDPHAQYVPHAGAPDPGVTTPRSLYDQEVWFTDKHVGRVLDFIAAQPWAADTAIVVTADHGEAFGEHGMAWHGREIWEPLVRVPLLVYVPGQTARRVPQKRSHIDLVPTILELAGVPLPRDPGELRGKSLLVDVFAPAGAALDERDVLIDMPQGPFNEARRAILTGPSPGMKLLHFGGKNYQLFDLAEDPAEKKDLARDHEKLDPATARLAVMRSRMKEVVVRDPSK